MKIIFNKEQLIKKFLLPISRIYNECTINITSDTIFTLTNDENSTILFCKMKATTAVDPNTPIKLNIKDIRKLVRVIECINDETFELEIDDNASVLKHKSKDLSFKLHLVTDSVIKKVSISLDKINKLSFNSEFILASNKIDEVLKGSAFATDSNKVYFFTKDGQVYAELTDKATQNIDSVTFCISNAFTGDEITQPIPFSLEFLRTLSATKTDEIRVKANDTYKIMMFETTSGETTLKYIISAFTK